MIDIDRDRHVCSIEQYVLVTLIDYYTKLQLESTEVTQVGVRRDVDVD